eukprot:comp16739_c0_seq1/m.15047 comp16739_c0_seq1/g.15047  ORF comp16739_c0_seq1/g.15047 comp16739_c0_seq1/m.15047 type:complete len:393 (-) comp16739_c0_seq1:586-1764(-)
MSKRMSTTERDGGEKKKRVVRVWCDGCYDMMHFGHANSLRQAKKMGDYLIVGVHSDAEIEKNKGPTVMNEEERYRMVAACKWVDEIVRDAPYVTDLQMMDDMNIDFVVHGDDITCDADGNDCYQAIKDAGRYRECKRTQGISTTNLVGRMLLLTKDHFANPDSGSLGLVDSKSLSEMGQGPDKTSPYTGAHQFLPTSQRIVQFSEGREPQPGQRVVYVSGAFDLFHVGHCDFLEAAKKEGDFLIVGLYTDQAINKYRGSNWPIMNLHERVLSVLSNRHVDDIVIGCPLKVTAELLDHFKVDVVVKGVGPAPKCEDGSDPFELAYQRGIVKEINSNNTLSADKIVERIIKNRLRFEARNKKKVEKELRIIEALKIGKSETANPDHEDHEEHDE